MRPLILILLVYGIGVFALALNSLRHNRLKEQHVILFFIIGLPFLALAIWPDAIAWSAKQLQIEYQTLMLLMVVGFLVLAVFELLSIISVMDRKITRLTQNIGLIEQELRETNDVMTPESRNKP